MSEDEWLEERNNIVEDLKLRFRQAQIEQEGNDPTLTGVSYGTPHDLASMHMSTDDVIDKDQGGRPPEGIKYGQHKNHMGWDPTGAKTVRQAMSTTFQPDPRYKYAPKSKTVATENADILKKIKKNRSKVLFEKQEKQNDAGSLLDENNIL